MTSPSIIDLANAVSTNTAKYHAYLVAQGLPLPSHEPSPNILNQSPVELPAEIGAARDAAINATYELHELLIGPYALLSNSIFQSSRVLSLDFIHKHKIAQSLGTSGTSTFKKIASDHNLNEDDTKRMLRLAMTNRIFQEPEPGVLAHTAASQALATNPFLAGWIGTICQEIWPGFLKTTEALSKWPGSQNPTETAFSLAHNFKDIAFVEWEKDPPRATQFSNAMKFWHTGAQVDNVLDHYDFTGKDSVSLIDVGGSHGEVAIAMADKYPQLSCIVQDFPSVVEHAESNIPSHLRSRVKFMPHDFFVEQPVKGADIYFFRWIFHDWSQPWGIKILRATIPALKPGARVIINDACVPPPGVLTKKQEMDLRTIDILMKSFTNSLEREASDWEALFRDADPGFYFLGLTVAPGSRDAVIQAEWRPMTNRL